MATATEIQSLETIQYKSKIKIFFILILIGILFSIAFLNFYPVGAEFKKVLKRNLNKTSCNPDYDQIRIEWLLPKIIVTDLNLPASCLGKEGASFKFSYININFQFINFSPLGLPFKIDTEFNGQPLTLYYVQGFGERMIRLKDLSLVLTRIQPLLGAVKLVGNIKMDLNLLIDGNDRIKNLSFKAKSKDLSIPAQNIESFSLPNLKINDFYIEANSESSNNIILEKIIVGDPEAAIRANLKGQVDLQEGAISMSPLNLMGEISFSNQLKTQLPILEMLFQSYTQKDGFYQIRLGGTLGAPKPAQL